MFEDSVSSIPSIWASMNSWFTPTVLFVLLNLMIGTIAITSSLASHKPHNHHQDHSHSDDHHHHHHHQQQHSSFSSHLGRSPSVLQRLRSINFYSYRSQEPTTSFHKSPETETTFAFSRQYGHEQEGHASGLVRSPSMLQRLRSINIYNYVISQPESQPLPPPELRREQALEPETPPREEEDRFDGDGDDDDQAESLDEIYSKLKGAHVGRSKSDTEVASAAAPAERRARRMKKSASAKAPAAREEESIEAVETRRPATVREGRLKAAAAEEEDGEVDARADDFINKFKQQLKLQRLDSILRARR